MCTMPEGPPSQTPATACHQTARASRAVGDADRGRRRRDRRGRRHWNKAAWASLNPPAGAMFVLVLYILHSTCTRTPDMARRILDWASPASALA